MSAVDLKSTTNKMFGASNLVAYFPHFFVFGFRRQIFVANSLFILISQLFQLIPMNQFEDHLNICTSITFCVGKMELFAR